MNKKLSHMRFIGSFEIVITFGVWFVSVDSVSLIEHKR